MEQYLVDDLTEESAMFLKNTVFRKENTDTNDEMPCYFYYLNNKIQQLHFSKKLSPFEAAAKFNENGIYNIIEVKNSKIKIRWFCENI